MFMYTIQRNNLESDRLVLFAPDPELLPDWSQKKYWQFVQF